MDWLIGIAPSDPSYTGPALTPTGAKSSSADRLRLLLRMSVDDFLRTFPNRENALNHVRGRLLIRKLTGRVAVFGTDAWNALGLPPRAFWESYQTTAPAVKFYLLPHPSGRCRLYNTSANRERLRRLFCRSSPLRSTTTKWSLSESKYRGQSGSQPAFGSGIGSK
jgi:hypothetical protein